MLEWVTANFIQSLGIEISQLKVLAKFVFLLVLDKADDRARIIAETLLYMQGRMILAIPWEPSFDLKITRTMAAPVWVDLLTLNPIFEDDVEDLLHLVGEEVYPAMKYSCSKYSNLRGCVKVDLTQPLADFVITSVPRIGEFKIYVVFRTLPDACFFCEHHGHMICDCKELKKVKRGEKENDTFHEIKRIRGSRSPPNGQRGGLYRFGRGDGDRRPRWGHWRNSRNRRPSDRDSWRGSQVSAKKDTQDSRGNAKTLKEQNVTPRARNTGAAMCPVVEDGSPITLQRSERALPADATRDVSKRTKSFIGRGSWGMGVGDPNDKRLGVGFHFVVQPQSGRNNSAQGGRLQ